MLKRSCITSGITLINTRIIALILLVCFFAFVNLEAYSQQANSKGDELAVLCQDAGFEILSYSKDFDVYKYQKAFLNFDRIDQFRKANQSNSFALENGEAKVILASAYSIQSKRALKSEPMGDQLPPLRFVLNVNGQVKEQPLN
jgi:hypothetical protein